MNFNMVLFLAFMASTTAAPTAEMELNPKLIGGNFEGDIMLPEGQSISNFMTRSGLIGDRYRWPQGRVIYHLDPAFTASERSVITSAMNEISSKTCIRFVQRTNQADYINVVRGKAGTGCYSNVGKIGGRQTLNLQSPGCVSKGTVAHEFIHAIGFFHEQSRTDRDRYVTINWSNIPQGARHNFDKYQADRISDQGISYDYGSLMHYGAYDFAINRNVRTIITPQGVSIGQNNGLSTKDASKIRNMYKC